eukprot:6406662-Karenia_brevis.AAC.1
MVKKSESVTPPVAEDGGMPPMVQPPVRLQSKTDWAKVKKMERKAAKLEKKKAKKAAKKEKKKAKKQEKKEKESN